MSSVPANRIRLCNSAPVRQNDKFVLYWMIAFRRTTRNFALDRAVEWARELRKPLVILDALRCDYGWANDRIHSFQLDGIAENARRLEGTGVLHYPFVEFKPGAGKGLLRALAAQASVVVTDEFPCFFLPQMVAATARQVPVRMEAIDSNGLLPLRAAEQAFSTAYAFRRFLQKNLPLYLMAFPKANAIKGANIPRARGISREITARWPMASAKILHRQRSSLAQMPINHNAPPVATRGGSAEAHARLKEFVRNKLDDYLEGRNHPGRDATSGLSAYLHFGHISAHEIFLEITRHEKWSAECLTLRPTGSREGWWGVRPAAEAFLEQLVTWRELGFNFCAQRKDYADLESLPDWALKTLRRHARDERSYVYSLAQFESAGTHDPLWNAAQTQLLHEGRMHNYFRMLWGKKILEWTPSAAKALEIMVQLNNKYAVDGRDPNSYSGIFWCLGRYDHPWGPERPIFGTVRYMSSANTARKMDVKEYLREYIPDPQNHAEGQHPKSRRPQRR